MRKIYIYLMIILLLSGNIIYADTLVIETDNDSYTYPLSDINYLDFDNDFINVNLDEETMSYDLESLVSIGFAELTNIDDEEVIPVNDLLQNYPNPFQLSGSQRSPATTIRFSLKEDLQINLEIYNIRGQKVRTLYQGFAAKGINEIMWTGSDDFGRDVTSGIYFYKLSSPTHNQMKKMLLIK